METPVPFSFVRSSWMLEGERRPLRSFNEQLDQVLGTNGVPMGRILEVSGAAGLGKTQLCLQLCSTVQLPACLGGLGGKAVFLDTEGSFVPSRMGQIADATKRGALEIMSKLTEEGKINQRQLVEFTERNFLNNILYKRLDTLDALVSAVENLVTLLEKEKEVKLIVLDSIAFHFRYMTDEENSAQREKRTTILARICLALNRAADLGGGAAVVVTNHATTKFTEGSGGVDHHESSGYSRPALGDSYSHFPTQRVVLEAHPVRSDFRVARLVKSPMVGDYPKPLESTFGIAAEGVRDIV